MKLHFFVRFYTRSGQHLSISGSIPQLGSGDFSKAVRMQYQSDEFWQLQIEVPDDELQAQEWISYRYIFQTDGDDPIIELKDDRLIPVAAIKTPEIQLVDVWNNTGEFENVFYTSPFRNVLLPERKKSTPVKQYRGATHIFRVKAPLLHKDETVCLLGSSEVLNNWDVLKPLPLENKGDWFEIKLNFTHVSFPIEYKYGVINNKTKEFLRFEAGSNRNLFKPANKKRTIIIHDGFVHLPNNTWKGSGVAIPVFSLRSKKSWGTGEFTDLQLLTDWASAIGMRLIQLLPVNDTISSHTWVDSYPYSAISAFALHPLYINLEKVAGKKNASIVKPFKKKGDHLNHLQEVDYESVIKLKLEALSLLYETMKEETFSDEEYHVFFESNRYWLVPYAAFSFLRDKYDTPDCSRWKQYSVYNQKEIEKLSDKKSKSFDKIAIHYFIQFHLHKQLKEAHQYAHSKGVILKGDIPIGINRYGSDAWTAPEWYDMNVQAGAPPDDFAIKGQNWGFPTYNWNVMQQDGYLWWKWRFEQMSNYFDAFRIDHILGFFRIWSIPIDAIEGILGRFVPAIPVHRNEFSERGIWFDYKRYCTPFITDEVLWEMFGPNEKKFKPFLIEGSDKTYTLKPEFQTQRQVLDHFTQLSPTDENQHIMEGLYDLISNVILFDEGGAVSGKFHFRINMLTTPSYKRLDDHLKWQLNELYVDYFFRRQDHFWEIESMKKLPALKRATDMLICGEDLGMVPHCVPHVMQALGILSLEIQRMPKNISSVFSNPAHAPYLSVVTPSTHDMSTIRGWWEEDRGKTQKFYNEMLGKYGAAPPTCEPWINKEIISQHLHSPAQWAIFQLQDILGIDEHLRRINPQEERINVPANPKHYWRYRMHIYLEDMLIEKDFNADLKSLIASSGRANFN
ncbi:4-alpha-glucanotransferase [Pollutibacter soli]|uniref:4-alpha-glucanotransferase n=1 Tax=Pollutibacter soli TaxID=3034157 RepID=UPI0030137AB7